jgi:hypothetical protein
MDLTDKKVFLTDKKVFLVSASPLFKRLSAFSKSIKRK